MPGTEREDATLPARAGRQKAASRCQTPPWRRQILRSILLAAFTGGWGTAPAHAEATFALHLGGAHTSSSSISLKQPSLDTNLELQPLRYRSESFDPPLYYAIRAGVFPHGGWFGIEGELIHLKAIADTARQARFDGLLAGERITGQQPVSAVIQRFSITHGVNLLLVNAAMRKTAGAESTAGLRWIFTGRLGAGASIPHAESVIGGVGRSGYEWGSFSVQAAAGIEVRLTKYLSASGEYKITHTVQDVAVAAGSARTPLTTHHVLAGLTVHVGAFGSHQ